MIFVSAFGFGLMPIFALYAYRGGINVPTLLFLRFGIAALCLFAYVREVEVEEIVCFWIW